MGRIIANQELRKLRLARLRQALLRQIAEIQRQPCFEGRLHPGYLALGRILYEAASRDYRPADLPKPLRACPWIFVLSELAAEFPEVNWNEQALARYVKIYLENLASGVLPVAPQDHTALDFERARKAGGF